MFSSIQALSLRRQVAIALVLSAAATALQLALSLVLGARVPFLVFIPVVALAAALVGRLPALLVLGAGALYGVYVLGPTYTFRVDDPADRVSVLMFVAVGGLFTYLGHFVRKLSRRAHSAELTLAAQRLRQDVGALTVFQDMFEQAPGFMALLRGPEHVFVMENAAYREFHGQRATIGRSMRAAFPELAGQGVYEILDQVYRSGVPYTAYQVPLQLRRGRQGASDQLYMDIVYQPWRDEQGQVQGIFIEGFDVTEQNTMRVALRESHLRLQQGLSAARMTMWHWDLRSERVEFLDNAEAVFQAGRAELDGAWALIDAADQPQLARLRATVVATRAGATATVRRTLPGGAPLWIELRAAPELDADGAVSQLRGVAIDVSAQTKAELLAVEHEVQRRLSDAKAKAADQRFQLAVDAARLGVFYCPLPFGTIYWNATCKAQFFLPPEAKVDIELFYRLVAPDDRAHVMAAIQRAVQQKTDYDVEYRTLAPDGRSRWIRAKGRVYCDEAGQPTRFDGITIDIQQQKEAEAALQAANQQKDDFLAMLAHELRNPLSPISSASNVLMLRGSDDEQVQRVSRVIDRQVRHMAGLLDDLLDVSRVTRGKIALAYAPVDLNSALEDAVEQVLPLIKRCAHQLAMRLAPQPVVVSGDGKRLVQVFVNLLTNAARYTPDGGAIELVLAVDGGAALVQVIDNGIGIQPALIPRLFDLFVQGERSLDRQQGGLGIGLSLVKRLTELHGGTAEAHSAGPGKGSQFTIRLPLARAAAGPAAASVANA